MSRRNFVLRKLVLVALIACGSASASPPRPQGLGPEVLDVSLAFARLPDAQGRAEVELTLEAIQAVAGLSVRAEVFGSARLEHPDPEAPTSLASGTSFTWRTRARFKPVATGIPPGLRVEIRIGAGSGGEERVILRTLPLVCSRHP